MEEFPPLSITMALSSAKGKNNHKCRTRFMPSTPSVINKLVNVAAFVPKQSQECKNREGLETLQGEEKCLFEEKLISETEAHAFSKHYTDIKSTGMAYNLAMNPHALFDNYTHHKALRFMAKSHVWNRRSTPTTVLPPAPEGVEAVEQFCKMDGDHAIYRVISEKDDKYILLACHLNVHGLHRGDLRFVEVNNRTTTNASKYSCIGHLALGDIVAVSELARLEEESEDISFVDVHKMTQETPCIWMVKRMTVLKRQTFEDVPFAFLTNGNGVALKYKRPLTVKNANLHMNREDHIYLGSGFIADKVPEFASGTSDPDMKELLGLTRGITQYPWATGTILKYEISPYFTNQIEIGHSAYSTSNADPEGCVEFCALMGATANAAVLAGNFDCRAFKMMDPLMKEDLITFKIENTLEPLPETLWKPRTRISIGSNRQDANAVIETVCSLGKMILITARLSRESSLELNDEVHMVSQRAMGEGKGLEEGFLEKIGKGTNGELILSALFGGRPIQQEHMFNPYYYAFPGRTPIFLNEDQNQYVNSLLQNVPITLANSPFGCGKSMTIATAAFYAAMRSRSNGYESQQLLVTQSNFASVNLVDITKKYSNLCRVIRYVTLNNWMELPEESRSDLDLPVLMINEFRMFVTGMRTGPTTYELFQMALYLKEHKALKVHHIIPRIRGFFRSSDQLPKVKFYWLTKIFFKYITPEIVITTADSLQSVLGALSKNIDTVQFDEASQMPESALIQVIARFPNACFGLVGDIRQLPPFSDYLLSENLKKYGIGCTLQRAIENQLFPQYTLRNVYRCHPFTTNLLGDMFYGGYLSTNVQDFERNEFMRRRPDFWPNSRCPIMVMNNGVAGTRCQTSIENESEVKIICDIIEEILGSNIKPSDIGVISFYKAQQSRLIEAIKEKDVKVGTVDSFQGIEKEIMIVGCTSEIMNSFVCNPNRVNVAMSRAKQATIIVGNLNSLREARYWKRFVKEAENHGCLKY